MFRIRALQRSNYGINSSEDELSGDKHRSKTKRD